MIAPDASGSLIQTGFAAGGAVTWSHTCTGVDRLLVVSVGLWQDVAGTGTITGITYNSVAMTQGAALTTGAMRTEIWYLINPTTGSNTVSATVSGNTDARKFASMSYVGAHQSVVFDASNTGGASTGGPTATLTTLLRDCWVQDATTKFGTGAFTLNGGQTVIVNEAATSTGFAASYKGPRTPMGPVTMGYSEASANDWSCCVLAFRPSNPIAGDTFTNIKRQFAAPNGMSVSELK
jgi:hypothetical protein